MNSLTASADVSGVRVDRAPACFSRPTAGPAAARSPLLVESESESVDPATWVCAHRDWMDAALGQQGGVLLRGFRVQSSADFEACASALCRDVKVHANFFRPGNPTGGNARTAVTYPHVKKIFWHNEDNFSHTAWPRLIMFYCATPATEGGETPVADCRSVLDGIDPEIAQEFVRKGVMYVDNIRPEFGTSWERVFGLSSRAAVEQFCRDRFMAFEWVTDSWLKVRSVRPAVLRHPRTGDRLWFNLVHLCTAMSPEQRQVWLSAYRLEDLPTTSYYGDGSPIDDAVLRGIQDAFQRAEVVFTWRSGDILILDNMLMAHGRNPFSGAREVYAGLGDQLTYADLLAPDAQPNPEFLAFMRAYGLQPGTASV